MELKRKMAAKMVVWLKNNNNFENDQFSHLLSSVCSQSIVHFIQSWFLTHYRIVMVVLYAPLRLSPTLTLQQVDGKLGETTVFG